MTIFMQPETLYHRKHPDELGDRGKSYVEEVKGNKTDTGISTSTSDLERVATKERDPYLGKGTPSKSQWGIFVRTPRPFRSLAFNFWIPWKLFLFPIVQFASFVVSWSASCFLTLNITQTQVLAPPPYQFSNQNIGFTNFAILIGALIGLATAGPLSDWVSMRATVKNNGIREPEMRLPAMIPYVFVMILGNFITAFGYEEHWAWPAIVVIGYGCAGLQVAALPALASTYAVDSYKPVAGLLFVSITVNKNVSCLPLSSWSLLCFYWDEADKLTRRCGATGSANT